MLEVDREPTQALVQRILFGRHMSWHVRSGMQALLFGQDFGQDYVTPKLLP